MLTRWAALTIVSKRFLELARVTAQSFCQHNPAIPFHVLLADEPQGQFEPEREPFSTLRLEDLEIPRLRDFQFVHPEMELTYACTPFAIQALLRRGCQGVLFLKQETLVLGDLLPVFELLDRHAVLLTPHLLAPPDRSNALAHELRVLRAGVYNGGVLGFANQPQARAFLNWWQDKLQWNCQRNTKRGWHFEQRWLDFVPSLVPDYHLIRDPGINVGHWNLRERQVRVQGQQVTAQGQPCRIFRFSGYQADQPALVTKYNRQYTVASTGEAAAVFARYQAMLEAAGFAQTKRHTYAFANYANGQAIPLRARRRHALRCATGVELPDPFAPPIPWWRRAFGVGAGR